MKIFLKDFDESNLIGKFVKCYEHNDNMFGRFFSIESLNSEYKPVYKLIENYLKIDTKFGTIFCLKFDANVTELDIYSDEEIELFETKPLTK